MPLPSTNGVSASTSNDQAERVSTGEHQFGRETNEKVEYPFQQSGLRHVIGIRWMCGEKSTQAYSLALTYIIRNAWRASDSILDSSSLRLPLVFSLSMSRVSI